MIRSVVVHDVAKLRGIAPADFFLIKKISSLSCAIQGRRPSSCACLFVSADGSVARKPSLGGSERAMLWGLLIGGLTGDRVRASRPESTKNKLQGAPVVDLLLTL